MTRFYGIEKAVITGVSDRQDNSHREYLIKVHQPQVKYLYYIKKNTIENKSLLKNTQQITSQFTKHSNNLTNIQIFNINPTDQAL